MSVEIVCPNCLAEFKSELSRECSTCKMEWESVKGIRYFGKIFVENANDLIELLSSSDRLAAEDYRAFDYGPMLTSIKELYKGEVSKSEFFREKFDQQEPFWWRSRWQEFLEFEYLTSNINFHGKKLLDVGAGYGSDAERYEKLGAEITAFEYSPAMFLIGSELHPTFQWIGGDASALPFKDETFDIVVAHHSLHHHHSFRSSLAEMLRVLKIGGRIITMGDPYTASRLSEVEECRIFNQHEGVLSGINEKVLNFKDFNIFIDSHQGALNGFVLICESGTDNYQEISIDQIKSIKMKSFSLALSGEKICKILNLSRSSSFSGNSLDIEDYIDTFIEKPTLAPLYIANNLPGEYHNLDIRSTNASKFMLLNGWHLYEGNDYRVASFKWRYFISSEPSKVKMKLLVDAPCEHTTLEILVNGFKEYSEIVSVGTLLMIEFNLLKFPQGDNRVLEAEIHCCGMNHQSNELVKSHVYEMNLQ